MPYDNLSLLYPALGDFQKSFENRSRAYQLDEKDSYAYQNLAIAYLRLGRLDEAKAIAEKGIARGYTPIASQYGFYFIAFATGDEAGLQRVLRAAAGTDNESTMVLIKGVGECSFGKLHAARSTFDEAFTAARRDQQKELGASIRSVQALCEAIAGYPEEAKRLVAAALAASDDRNNYINVAMTTAFIGDASRTEKLAKLLEQQYPRDLLVNREMDPDFSGRTRVAKEAARGSGSTPRTRPGLRNGSATRGD